MVSLSILRLVRQRTTRLVLPGQGPQQAGTPPVVPLSLADVLAGQGDSTQCADVLAAHEAVLTTEDLLQGVRLLRGESDKVNLFATKCAESADFFPPDALSEFCRIFAASGSDDADALFESALARLQLQELTIEHVATILKALKVAKKGDSSVSDCYWSEEIPTASATAVVRLLEALPRSAPEDVIDALFARFAQCLLDDDGVPMRIVVRALSAASAHDAGDEFLHSVTDHICERRAQLEAIDAAFCLRAARRFDGRVPDAFFSTILMEIPRLASSLNRRDVFMILRSLGNKSIDREFLAWLAAEVQRDVGTLSVQEVSDAVRVFSSRKYNSPKFFLQMMKSYLNGIDQCSPSEAVTCLYNFAKMPSVSPDRVFAVSYRKLDRECLALTPRDIALGLWSFARHRRPELAWLSKSVEPELIRHVNRSGGYTSHDVSLILWSLACGEPRRVRAGINALMSHITDNIRSFPPKALVVACVALGRMNFKTQVTLAQLYRAVYAHVSSMTTNQICVTFLLMANSGLRDLDITLRFVHEVQRRPLKPKNLNLCCLALAQLEDTEVGEPEVWNDFKFALKQRTIETLRAHPKDAKAHLGIFETAGALGFSEEEMAKLMGRLECMVPEYSGEELLRLLISLAILQQKRTGLKHISLSRAIFNALRWKAEPFDYKQLLSCFHSLNTLGYSTHKIRKKLGSLFKIQVLRKQVSKRVIVNNIQVMEDLGVWQRLPMGTQNKVWERLAEDVQETVTKPTVDKREAAPVTHRDELYVVPTRKRYNRRVLSAKSGLERLPPKTLFEPMDAAHYLEERPEDSSPFHEFIELVKQK
eukprot:GEMP01009295.1.p1 GENE.GEMP01009295.1~~GEMP01009295.1.p1  ORF type:complete len:820 (+),score=177.30 GEMP01009295.1:103-2562(+)